MSKRHISRLLQPGVFWYCIVMLLFTAAAAAFDQFYLAGIELIATIAVFVISRILLVQRKRTLMQYVQSATDAAGISVHAGSPFPMAVLRLPDNEIIWGNPAFFEISGLSDSVRYQSMEQVLPGFHSDWLREGRSELPGDQTIGGRRYRIYGNYIRSEDETLSVMLATIYFADLTEMLNVRDEFMRSRPVVALILVDNYDELMGTLPDTTVAKLDAEISDTVSHWANSFHALCRKVERNRFLLIFENRDLLRMQEEKFPILENIRTVVNPSGIAATVSLGIGKDGTSFDENYSFATLSIEMSLSRGGDQAVIKDRYNFSFFGGHSREAERHTRVKSRVMAGSLAELISQSSTIYIMGHRMADLDSLGAAVGLTAICRKRGKEVKIVIDLQNNASQALIAELRQSPDFYGTFLSGQDALVEADSRSLLIVVDTNRPEQVESRELLESISRVAVIDHHRRAADYIDQAVLNLHEPFASSASELVTELLQYILGPRDICPIEAQALLAGLVLDTKKFSVRTGSRTFEAAAFLRRSGADPVEVKKLFQDDLNTALLRYQVIQNARLYRSEIAIAACETTLSRTIAAQAADELLNISGILSSFVLYPDNGQIVISARSIGECNVQLVLEKLGGGGNAATAGAQIRGKELREVLSELVASIDRFYES